MSLAPRLPFVARYGRNIGPLLVMVAVFTLSIWEVTTIVAGVVGR